MNGNLAYREEFREERIGGKMVMMSPRPSFNHNQVAYNIARLFGNYLKGRKCTPIADGMDLFLSDEDWFVPDFMIVCDPDKLRGDGVHGAPDLVVEVLSPTTMWNDRTHKKDVYGRCGVREYWIVAPEEKTVEVYLSDGTELILQKIYTLYPDWMLKKMSEQERAAVEMSFKCSLYDDLDISLEDIFYRTL